MEDRVVQTVRRVGGRLLGRHGWTLVAVVATAIVASAFDVHEMLDRVAHGYEAWDLDELLMVLLVGLLAFGFSEHRRLRAEVLLRRRLEEDLRAQALHDPLTGVANRILVFDRLDQALSRLDREGGVVAIGYLDLDGFKAVNDSHGHDVGDQCLLDAARRLTGVVREGDSVGRLGGDEFVIVCHCETEAAGREVIERARRTLSGEVHGIRVTASAGFVVVSEPMSSTSALRAADRALYRAKASGRDRLEQADRLPREDLAVVA